MAVAAMPDPVRAFENLSRGYIAQHVDPEPGRKMPSAQRISASFRATLDAFFGQDLAALLQHPRYRLHITTSRGKRLLAKEGKARTPIGFAGLALGNAVTRKAVGLFMERTLFSTPGEPFPLPLRDLPTGRVELSERNFVPAMLASCSIPFMLEAVHDIPGSKRGAHWDGGIVDYHFHWPYSAMSEGLVLYPHFQQHIVPGWLDKALKWRHRPSPWLDNVVLLVPNPQWVAQLPGGKLPDRNDFAGLTYEERVRRWTEAVSRAAQLREDWCDWLDRGCPAADLLPL
jgi:predicted acylesterase/phospholipase RssA